MAATLASPGAPAPLIRLPLDGQVPPDLQVAPLAELLEPALMACQAAISWRVREGSRPMGGGLLTSLVDAVEVGQTTLDLSRRGSPLVPSAKGLARLAFGRAEAACRERGGPALEACADALRDAARGLRDGE